MSIIQKFYDNMASHYDKLFLDWKAATKEQAVLLQGIFQKFNFGQTTSILDCACGIGTQAIGLALLGYDVTASDISDGEIAEAKAGVKRIRIHDLRHSCASYLIHKGVSIVAVSRHLGHSSTKQTLDTYSHLLPDDSEIIRSRLDELFKN